MSFGEVEFAPWWSVRSRSLAALRDDMFLLVCAVTSFGECVDPVGERGGYYEGLRRKRAKRNLS
jgi:hypothetical protein